MIVVAVGLMVDDDKDRVLIQQRPRGDYTGLWEFPGGKVDAGETVRKALVREWTEELGIDTLAGTLIAEARLDLKIGDVLLQLFRVWLLSGEITGLEGQKIEWVSIDEAFSRPGMASMEVFEAAVRDHLDC